MATFARCPACQTICGVMNAAEAHTGNRIDVLDPTCHCGATAKHLVEVVAFQMLLRNLHDDVQDLRAMAAINKSETGAKPFRDLAADIEAEARALECALSDVFQTAADGPS